MSSIYINHLGQTIKGNHIQSETSEQQIAKEESNTVSNSVVLSDSHSENLTCEFDMLSEGLW